MECGLRLGIAMIGTDRASAAGRTRCRPAVLASALEVLPTGCVVVGAVRHEGGDWASRKAGPFRTLIAGIWAIFARGELKPFSKPECSAVGMPQAPFRMNEQTQGRAINRLGFQRPALEIEPGRPAEGIERRAVKISRDLIYQSLRPSVERIGKAVIGLWRGREHRPLVAACPAQQHDRQGRCAIRKLGHAVFGFGMKGSPERKTEPVYVRYQSVKSRYHNRAGVMDWSGAISLLRLAAVRHPSRGKRWNETTRELTGRFISAHLRRNGSSRGSMRTGRVAIGWSRGDALVGSVRGPNVTITWIGIRALVCADGSRFREEFQIC